MARSGFPRSILAATAVHLAIVGWFAMGDRPVTTAVTPVAMPEPVEIEIAEPTRDEPAVAARAEMPAAVTRVEARAAVATAGERATPSTTNDAPAEVVAVERATDWVVHPTTGSIDLSVPKSAFAPGGALHVAPVAEHPPIPVAPLSKSGGLVEGLDARDVGLGLGRGGPIQAAVAAAAHDPAAPVLGSAVFSVSVLEGGNIVVDTLKTSSERAAWEKLAPMIAKSLADKPMHVPSATKGIRVTISVDAKEQFASGAKPVPDAKQGVTGGASVGKVTEKKDHIDIVLPHAYVGYRTRKCMAGIAVTPGAIGFTADCEVGVAVRVVETRIVREERL